jgi:phosphoglycolate phosphatase
MKKARAVVFDLDGTLVDSLDDISAATNFALAAHGHGELATAEIAGYVGDGARLLLARAARLEPTSAELAALLATFLERYTAHAVDHTRLSPGAEQALSALCGLPLAICTNKPRPTTEAVLGLLGVRALFSSVVAGGDTARNKPDPEPLVRVASELGLSSDELVMVGDLPQDVLCGRAAGARTVAVLGGFASADRLSAAQPDAVIESLRELPAVVRRFL